MSVLNNRFKRLKSAIALVLAFAIVISTFTVISTITVNAVNVWDGSSSAPKTGSGTASDPYLITDGSELHYAISNGGGAGVYYKLTDDIYLNDPDKVNWSTGEAIGDYSPKGWIANNAAFEGIIDGDGHIVYGLYYDCGKDSVSWGMWGNGLIPRVLHGKSVSITGLGIDKAYIKGESGVSAFVGCAGVNSAATTRAKLSFDKCFVGKDVTLIGNDVGAFRGVTRGSDLTVSNCYSLAAMQGKDSSGIFGSDWEFSANISNSYILGAFSSYGWRAAVTLTNSYQTADDDYDTTVSSDMMQGKDVLSNPSKMPNLDVDGTFSATDTFPVLTIFIKKVEDNTDIVWNGEVATEFVAGSGTRVDPYLIRNGSELALAISSGGNDAFYKLANDIYLNDVNKIDWTTGKPIGDYEPNEWFVNLPFSGSIDGNGYTVFGLYSDWGGDSASVNFGYSGRGLIPRVNDGKSVVISKLGVDCAYVNGNNGASAFVGFAGVTYYYTPDAKASVTIDQCYVGENVLIQAHEAGAFRGGSNHSDVTLTNSYSLATINAVNATTAGLFGNTWNSSATIKNCYNAKGAVCTEWSTKFTASSNYSTREDKTGEAFYASLRIADNMKGLDVFTNASKMPNLNANEVFTATAEYPVLTAFIKGDPADYDYWDGLVAVSFAKGDGSENAPYEISTPQELALAISSGGNDKYYVLTADIYLNNLEKVDWSTGKAAIGYVPNSWYSNVAFSGTIDGNGHTVYGLYYNSGATASNASFGYNGVGLVPRVNDGKTVTITKLGVDNAFLNNINGASAFVGFAGVTYYYTPDAKAKVIIDQCYAGENVTIEAHEAGAFRGGNNHSDTTITNSYSLAAVTALNSTTAGLLGNTWNSVATIKNTYNAKGAICTEWSSNFVASSNYSTREDKTGEAFYATLRTADMMKGHDVFTNASKMPNLNSEELFVATEGYPVLVAFTDDNDDDDPVLPENPDENEFWNGYTTTAPTKGEGTATSPYEISTSEELAYMISSGGNGKYYKLTADIYLNDITKINWKTGAVDSGYTVNKWYNNIPFEGTIDGNGHTVFGLYYNADTTPTWGYEGVGLIPRVNRGKTVTVSKLAIDNAYFCGKNCASAFVGFAGATWNGDTATGQAELYFDRCFAGENVTVVGADAGIFRGGARYADTTIFNSYSLGAVEYTSDGGLVGNVWNANVNASNVYNANGPFTSEIYNSTVTLTNVFQTVNGNYDVGIKTVSAENMKGLDALENSGKMLGLNSEDCFVATEGYPELRAFNGGAEEEEKEEPGDIWTGAIATSFASGMGTENDPYIISTAAELARAVKNNGFNGKYFKLSHDIYLNDVSEKMWYANAENNKWIVSGSFNGQLDGDGHIVYGVWFPDDIDSETTGLITKLRSGWVKNIGVRFSQITAKRYAGAVVGSTAGGGGHKIISGCFADETVYVSTNHIDGGSAGILGMAADFDNSANVNLTVSDCYSKARLTALTESAKNGIIGSAWRTGYSIYDCYSIGYPVYNADLAARITSAYWNYDGSISEARDGRKLSDYIYDCYSDVSSANKNNIYTYVADSEKLRGDAAKTSMAGLNYVNVFETVSNGTPKLKIFASITGEDIFSSKEADFYGEGIGTQQDPFIIKTVEHLRYLVESLDTKGKYYKLGNDIYVNNTKLSNWMSNSPALWYASSNQDHCFAGNLDGNGYTIYGLYYNEKPNPSESEKKACYVSHGTALFPYASSEASIRNLHIRDSFISGKGCVAAFVGCVLRGESSKFEMIACSVDESVKLHGYTVGGLIGAANKGINLTYCYSTAKLTTDGHPTRINGLIGDIWGAKASMLECYTVGRTALFGPIAATDGLYTTVEQQLATVIQHSQMIGASAKKYMPDFDWNNVWYVANGKTPQLKVVPYGAEEAINSEGVRDGVWSGKIATQYAGGSGTKDDPYLIETPEQLALLVSSGSSQFKYYVLIADIKLNDTSASGWEQNARPWFAGKNVFRGVFDGNGHVVSGLYYYNTANENYDNIGIFQRLGHSSTIMRLGVTKSTIINTSPYKDTYAAAIVGYIEHWEPKTYPDRTAPTVKECFADHTVYVEASTAGGIVGGCQTKCVVENSYFTGELSATTYAGAIVGDAWRGDGYGPTIINCYASTYGRDALGSGVAFNSKHYEEGTTVVKNSYVDGPAGGASSLSILYMKGADAKKNMKGFDWNGIWSTSKGTPVLRCFANASKYSCTRDAVNVQISFSNAGPVKLEPIYGIPGFTKITEDLLPTPERYGYIFTGWHHFNEYGAPFELDVFPNYNITLYASWESVGFTVNFENNLDEKYDFNSGIEVVKPGAVNYDPKFVRSGWRSLHAKADSDVAPMFLISYENPLEVGKEYEFTFWVSTDNADTSGTVEIVHTNYPDVNDETVGYQTAFEATGIKEGEWKEFKFTAIANAPYILVRCPGGCSLYFEDIQVVPTGAEGEVGNISGLEPDVIDTFDGLAPAIVVIIIASGAVLAAAVLAVIIVAVIVIVKKAKKKVK